MTMLETLHTTDTVVPSLEVIHTGKQLKKVKFRLSTKIGADHEGQKVEIGNGYAHIINEAWIPGTIMDYVDSLIQEQRGHIKQLTNQEIFEFNLYRELYQILERSEHIPEIKGTITVLHSIRLYEDFRNQKLFPPFMSMILTTFKEHFGADFVLLDATPIDLSRSDEHAYKTEKNRLERMYAKFRFTKKIIPGKDSIMLLHVKK